MGSFERPVFRPDCKLPATDMKTYAIVAPKSSHFRPGTCAEARCSAYLNGWTTKVDVSTELGRRQEHYIRHTSGRKFKDVSTIGGGPMVEFLFEAGQKCFREHQIRLSKPEVFLVRDGDYRGNPRGTQPRIHANADDWVDDFANHQDKLITLLERG